jgi:hypothetical protein
LRKRGDLGVDVRTVLKLMLKKYAVDWVVLAHDRVWIRAHLDRMVKYGCLLKIQLGVLTFQESLLYGVSQPLLYMNAQLGLEQSAKKNKQTSRTIALSWRGVLRAPMTRRAMLAGA